jgi:hypothetical protein
MIRSTVLVLMGSLALPACSESNDDPGPGSDACAPLRHLADIVQVYGSAWNETSADKRLCALRQSMTENATYIDPTIDTANLPALSDAIGEFQTSAPKAWIGQLSGLDARAGELRFEWEFKNDGVTVITGHDYMEIAPDGRIASIRGYWNPVPTEAPTGVLADYVAAWKATDAAARGASLAAAAAADVRFTSSEVTAAGLDALAAAMQATGAATEVTGAQAYPKFARVTFAIGADRRQATDYVHLGGDGKITRVARFVGSFPPP